MYPPPRQDTRAHRARAVAVVSNGTSELATSVREAFADRADEPQFFLVNDVATADAAVIVEDSPGEWACSQVEALEAAGFAGPILVVAARLDEVIAGQGYAAGALAWLAPPLIPTVLRAQVSALCQRLLGDEHPELDVRLHPATFTVGIGQRSCELEPQGFLLFRFLWLRREHWQTQEQIVAGVWATHHDPASSVVRVQVSKIRAALGELAWLLQSKERHGYRISTQADATPARTMLPHPRYHPARIAQNRARKGDE